MSPRHDAREREPDRAAQAPYDLLGLGFGPANLALAVAIREQQSSTPLRARFLERRAEFAWHPGMLLAGARMQVSFLKDLVTLRNPSSPFTFLQYLRSRGRLDEFINLEEFRPTRTEFNDYLRWAAEQVSDLVDYGREVVSVAPLRDAASSRVDRLEITTRGASTGETVTHATKNLVLGCGHGPRIPPGTRVDAGGRVVHSNDFLPWVERHFTDRSRAYAFVVIGDGQSAAEVFDHLASRFPNARVTAAMRDIAYRPMDDSAFVNEWFFPRHVDDFHELSIDRRRALLVKLRNTNYSVVDLQLIERIYRTLYDARVTGRDGLSIRPFADFVGAEERHGGVSVTLQDSRSNERDVLAADGLVLATGFVVEKRPPVLDEIAPWIQFDEAGDPVVERDYRVRTRPEFTAGVYLQGYCQASHGIADTLLSIMAIRSGEILSSVRERCVPIDERSSGAGGRATGSRQP